MAGEVLKILGRASDSIRAKYMQVFNIDKNDVLLFCDFSEFDIPLGTVFTVIEDMEGSKYTVEEAVLKSVSQGFFLPFDMVPRGHKTICLFSFLAGPPEIIQRLPVISDWYESKGYFILQ
ncbi:hypothetical protein HF329_31985 [Chitinophaga oryzae]|uniref:Uncharacterized protein n=1 Tax=Chitinophaga oryzae TaxID=2725414 RepID=A0AAE7DAV1_9BACT|nr:hypothetical protein [Chitinophaga oryzae]QJB35666.1 hypothetical protein HF329_31945 [Chitinophaga oryzae]QJB35672.1 hypothetical protein HF329_31985 [Chitinophaga oryzae]